ncbi:aminoglycoside phosphotransferase family protein [Legionella pneumophila]|uniref:phosphotransferase n=1 Tax=Legionella pneumophila TaxID=446 RepID=UPI0007708C3C|nr:phosphotransferase [Legionella pneumophila]HAT8870870.1 phosphotransferase [Legionella pneumophila subsp. pneumophila]MDF1929643.1 phosphotransferase [Legionella pneumophila]PYB42854.1 aminoglycoside phosphotransferase family protein [Legionella pneumophila]PYB48073.1 aminoglycoside phosphotransferase family protein [Legionella pneumophila]PYB60658.1 aminoglycoside phosphotransferase family protein [Legionella pneumophila]
MKNNDAAIQWAVDYLESNDCRLVSVQKIVEPAHSIVNKINTSQGVFYLKQTPPTLFIEPDTISLLKAQGCQHVPTVIAKNDRYHCFLTTACGDVTLHALFSKTSIDIDLLGRGISHYASIQRNLENDIPKLITFGLPDWRLDKFPLLYRELIQETEQLVADGLSQKEITTLNKAYDFCVELCERLSQYKIPETINHCDFQDNNILVSQKTGELSIIDWGETVISHPFFSLNTCLWNLTYFYNMKLDDFQYQTLQRFCVSSWLDSYEESDLITAFNITNELLGIFAAMNYKRMYDATTNQSKTVQEEHPGSIAGCLRSFICVSELLHH